MNFFFKGVDNEDDDVNGSSGCIDVKKGYKKVNVN